jgi:gamma-glutamylcyclotransferase (GGCT)/AIG2-like uncharacterized protein YtfP
MLRLLLRKRLKRPRINILDPLAESVEIFVFESADLPSHWARLDAFEGDEYRRVTTQVSTDEGEVSASIDVVAVERATA